MWSVSQGSDSIEDDAAILGSGCRLNCHHFSLQLCKFSRRSIIAMGEEQRRPKNQNASSDDDLILYTMAVLLARSSVSTVRNIPAFAYQLLAGQILIKNG